MSTRLQLIRKQAAEQGWSTGDLAAWGTGAAAAMIPTAINVMARGRGRNLLRQTTSNLAKQQPGARLSNAAASAGMSRSDQQVRSRVTRQLHPGQSPRQLTSPALHTQQNRAMVMGNRQQVLQTAQDRFKRRWLNQAAQGMHRLSGGRIGRPQARQLIQGAGDLAPAAGIGIGMVGSHWLGGEPQPPQPPQPTLNDLILGNYPTAPGGEPGLGQLQSPQPVADNWYSGYSVPSDHRQQYWQQQQTPAFDPYSSLAPYTDQIYADLSRYR